MIQKLINKRKITHLPISVMGYVKIKKIHFRYLYGSRFNEIDKLPQITIGTMHHLSNKLMN